MVDDSIFNLTLLREMLSSQNYQVDQTTRGKEALCLIKQKIYDLIILDVVMPEMNGFEVCKAIKQHETYKDIPIIFVTSDQKNMVKGFQAGAVDYISKSYNQTELLARVDTHLKLRMSQRKLIEMNQQLEKMVKIRTAALEKALDELDIFFYRISHDMRSPITTLKGVADLLRNYDLQKDAQEILGMLITQVDKVEKLNRSLVEVGEIRTQKVNLQSTNLYNIIQETLEMLAEELNEAPPVNFLVNIPLNQTIITDQILLSYALDNIIENSLHHASPNASYIEVEINLDENERSFLISFQDNGPGFYPTILHKVFDMFTRGSSKSSRFGLGLYKARLAIEKMQGQITCSNLPEQGALVLYRITKVIFPIYVHTHFVFMF